jgi:hypothetical protein
VFGDSGNDRIERGRGTDAEIVGTEGRSAAETLALSADGSQVHWAATTASVCHLQRDVRGIGAGRR